MPAHRTLVDGQVGSFLGALTSLPVVLTLGATSNNTNVSMSSGTYELCGNVACHVRQVPDAGATVTATNAHYCPTGLLRMFTIGGGGDDFVAAVAVSGQTGFIHISKR